MVADQHRKAGDEMAQGRRTAKSGTRAGHILALVEAYSVDRLRAWGLESEALQLRRTFMKSLFLVALAGLFAAGATGGAAPADPSGYFVGQLADGRAVFFTLQREGTNLNATVMMEGSATPCSLSGVAAVPKGVVLTGNDQYSSFERWGVTNLSAQTTGDLAQWNGVLGLRGTAGGMQFTATNVASIEQCGRTLGLKVAGRGGGKEFTGRWPQFRGDSPFLRTVSARLAAEAKDETRSFVSGGLGVAWEGLKTGGVSWSWEGTSDVHLAWLSANCLSLYQEGYEFTGGAHGNLTVFGRNFVFHEGKVREFALTNLFQPGRAWEKSLASLCLRELRRQQAGFVVNGMVKELKAGEMTAFTFDRFGVVIHFQDYAVASHAEGLFHVFLPWAELRPLLNPAGPARFLPGALESH